MKNYTKDIEFTKKYLKENKNLDYDYSWHHALNTAVYLEKIAVFYKEFKKEEIKDLFLAGLGHDLLEDTKVSEKELEKKWGSKVVSYIKFLTNWQGDDNFDIYLKKLQKSPEEVFLVKLVDIYTNTENSLKNFNKLDKKWLESFWLPLLNRYKNELFDREIIKYPKTIKFIINEVEINIKKLDNK